MDQDKKKQKEKGRFSEILRRMLCTVVVVFLVSWMAFLSLDNIQMKQRLAAIDDKMITEETLKKIFSASQHYSDTDEQLDAKALLVRKKRALALNLESLEKRVKVLEFR